MSKDRREQRPVRSGLEVAAEVATYTLAAGILGEAAFRWRQGRKTTAAVTGLVGLAIAVVPEAVKTLQEVDHIMMRGENYGKKD